jgi:beta-galactosidase
LTLILAVLIQGIPAGAAERIPLAGSWAFRLDPDGVGLKEKWYSTALPGKALLPGSLDEQSLGFRSTQKHLRHLTREFEYVGSAWYQKRVTIPEEWRDGRVVLFLERCHWETRVWVDGCSIDSRNSLSTPHLYDLTDWLPPGEHLLTLCVDNTVRINIGHTHGNMLWTHAITEETQTNWNGIIGRIELRSTPLVWLKTIRVYPDLKKGVTRVTVTIGNATGLKINGTVDLALLPDGGTVTGAAFSAGGGEITLEKDVPLGDSPRLWDEFSPELYDLRAGLTARAGRDRWTDERSVRFGLREFRASGQRFEMNGRPLFLRGNVDSAVFPLTGYPPMTLEEWKRLFGIVRSYGMNHVRFHSWCPPEAAFAAADELGMMLQAEPPLWDGFGLVGSDRDRAAYILAEADRIVDVYGNHPSFCLMSMGNELGNGKDPFLRYLLDYLKKKDGRHLYTTTTHPAGVERDDDYFVAAGTAKGVVRGVRPFGDFDAALEGLTRPLITHEVGQPAMCPDYDEIAKYTGHLKPLNLEAFRRSLAGKKMLEMAGDFRVASGALLVEIYKENIEAQLRSRRAAGFQLLDLQDFSGQGTALIGVLDAFYDSKGLITPEDFRRFCAPTVPLIRMRGFNWKAGETLTARAEVAHYGAADLEEQAAAWTIRSGDGNLVASGRFDPACIPTGRVTSLGDITAPLDTVGAPVRLVVEVTLPGTLCANSWNFWVYPDDVDTAVPEGIVLSRKWDGETRKVLAHGGTVFLLPDLTSLARSERSRWHPIFWSYQLFSNQPKTMGILCNPDHAAFSRFPTAYYADWQWHDLLERSVALVLDEAPPAFRPLVQFVPDFNSNQKLSAVFEARVGPGRLMVSTIDLENDLDSRPNARQLRHSLLAYMRSDDFRPAWSLDTDLLDKILEPVPVLKNEGAPTSLDKAAVNIRAAVHAPPMVPKPWSAAADQVISLAEGFGYTVGGSLWRDNRGTAWHGGHLVVNVDCPPKCEGTFYAHFHDWNNEKRSAALFFAGRDLGPLSRYGGDGFWLRIPVTAAMTAEGSLVLDARVTSGPNVMISQIVFLPKQGK